MRPNTDNNRAFPRVSAAVRAALPAVLLAFVCLLSACGEPRPLLAYERGMAYLESGDREQALSCFEESSTTEGEEALGFRGAGLIYLERGDYKKAADAFLSCLDAIKRPRLNKAFAEDVQLYLADAYEGGGQLDKAMDVYSKLLDGDRAGEAYLLRGKLYAKTDKFGQAGQDFQRAVEMDPSYEVYLQIYDTYVSLNRQADGAVFLREAQANSSDTAEDAFQLGRINYFLGDYARARECLLKAVNGSVPGSYALLGRICLDEGDISGARTVYQQAIDSGLDAAAGHNGLALCMIETGEYQKALQQIHEGLMTGEGTCSEELRFNEIIVYERQGEFETAIEKMESFIEAYPGNEEAKREYLFLQSRMKEINSMPEDVSGKVWADIVRQWEEEEASAGGETNEETGQDYGYTEDEGYYEDGGETYDDGYYEETGETYDTGYYEETDETYSDGTDTAEEY